MAKTTKSKALDRDTVRAIMAEIEAAVQKVAQKHGLTVKASGASFKSSEMTPKLKLFAVNADGVSSEVTSAARDFEVWGSIKGLQPAWLNKTFVAGRSEYKVVGFDKKRPKNCIILERLSDGAKASCTAQYLKSVMTA
jgi:hypothetical protein